jgi:hypothetical protein
VIQGFRPWVATSARGPYNQGRENEAERKDLLVKRNLLPRSCVTIKKTRQYTWKVYERKDGMEVATIKKRGKHAFTVHFAGADKDYHGPTSLASAIANVLGSL